jgi:hypothetical protein
MISEKLSVIIIASLFINSIIIWYVKDKAYRKGVEKGQFEVVRSMLETATWMGTQKDKSSYNTLWLFASKYKKYGYVSSDNFRAKILSVNHSKRITDLSKEEIKKIV